MAVYEHTYKEYAGPLTPEWSRFLIIPRHAYKDVFSSKIFTAFFALCFVCPLVMAILIYLHHNVSALQIMDVRVKDLVSINSEFFRIYLSVQCSLGFLLTLLIGPTLVSRDLSNNALPLYLCRPFSRSEYVIGKMAVLILLISAITWVPGILLFLFQSYLDGFGWFTQNAWLGWAILAGSWTWILTLSLLSLTLSAWVKWRIAASAGLFALFIIPTAIGAFITEVFSTRWGNLISLSVIMQSITDSLFRERNSWDLDVSRSLALPAWSAWMMLGIVCAGCLLLLARKVRAYEVIR
jgi:ABC-2 type transport system permease protein